MAVQVYADAAQGSWQEQATSGREGGPATLGGSADVSGMRESV